jgi:hypothetical protein
VEAVKLSALPEQIGELLPAVGEEIAAGWVMFRVLVVTVHKLASFTVTE